ncbi:helix-turn-helix transcriptional regulator [Mediterraneibacter glycyrrhizinilyticus]|uniref:helix-turn-helix domain-containing protein n=1 Tax=Mediterraneibacter glycyrrhizinilyticus TaxID=342942 RepID=UPI001D06FE9D|nr:helix-turn-helix transcriptional regulator [Mediterraneibacter glycyrrhizinilyticus]MCB6310353.1 helix-turn-helix transcriptional regulator [Lachnospiraceae bacterium 210521-DFI.1.109]MCB6427853.1 helix-turn-helix transcriptional regulator [Mediterraneibacter glycyrrhizinilyticus]
MKNRILKIRKDSKLNQEDFGLRLNLTKNYISLIETGNRIPSDRTISDICREFNVNEDWLRNGIGDMYKEKDGSFTELLSELEESDDDFIKSLITVYMGLDEDSKSALRKIAKGMAEKYKSREN